MKRLTKDDLNKVCYDPWEICGMDKHCTKGCHEEGGCTVGCHILKMYRKLADYEDKEEQGLLIDVPVAIGETVYRINEYAENPFIPMSVVSFEFKGVTNTFKEIRCKELGFGGEGTYRFTDIGKTLFLTRSEAEEALAQMKGD